MKELLLASGSKYRVCQLSQLQTEFGRIVPRIDESPAEGENPKKLALRLAIAKASKVKAVNPSACVIGSDQVCAFNGQIYGKPGNDVKAREQLQTFSNNCIEFFTALCVINNQNQPLVYVDTTLVTFRELTTQEIKRYIDIEQPLDCAGSFKVESLGLSLFESIESTDPSALMGLPLIKLSEFLRSCGYQIP